MPAWCTWEIQELNWVMRIQWDAQPMGILGHPSDTPVAKILSHSFCGPFPYSSMQA